jgi:uncharacterized protein
VAQWSPDGPPQADCHLILTHGAGAPATSPVITTLVEQLNEFGVRTACFEFDYMAARRQGGSKRPPPRVETLTDEFRAIVSEFQASRGDKTKSKIIIGGKSMGGRVASLIAEDLYSQGAIAGWLAIGYPFHPAKHPDRLRTAHLKDMRCTGLIIQGTRDALGNRTEVAGYEISNAVRIRWCEDGDHDLKPRRASGLTHDDTLSMAAEAINDFWQSL